MAKLELRGFLETVPAEEIVNHLAEALPVPGRTDIDAIRPDLIGEAFLLQGMREHERFPTAQTEIVERTWQRAGGKVAATLIRTAQDFARGDAKHCSVAWLAYLIDRTQDWSALAALVAELPEQTLALRELAADAEERLSGMLSQQVGAEPDALSYRAGALNNLAVRLSALGRREPVLAAAEEAVAIRRELAAQQPDAFRPDLASSLSNLANSLSDLGRREPALAVEAAALHRELAARQPDAFRPHLARSLSNLAKRLSALGRRESALAAAEEAVAIRRELAEQQPDAFRPDLAISLSTQANCLDALSRMEDALTTSMAAVANLAPAFVQQPAAFGHWMWLMLQEYLRRCENLGRPPDMRLLGPILAILQRQGAQTGEQPG